MGCGGNPRIRSESGGISESRDARAGGCGGCGAAGAAPPAPLPREVIPETDAGATCGGRARRDLVRTVGSMTVVTAPGPVSIRPLRLAVSAAGVLLLCLILGALTSYGQTVLPVALAPLANSSSGWTLALAALVWAARLPTAPAAVTGAAGFALLTVGYAVASTARGFFYDPTFFILVGLVAGAVVGTAAAWLRTRGMRAAVGTAVLAGILAGEAVYGLTVVADTTSPVTWMLFAALAVALVVTTLVRARALAPRIVTVAGALALAAAFPAAYLWVGAL